MTTSLDIIIPCYNECECIPLIYTEIAEACKSFDDILITFIFIDDGSSDETLDAIKKLRAVQSEREKERVRYISFSRNFGKEAAIYAGLEASSADYIAIMDCDLQDPPAMLGPMLDLLMDGKYDICAVRRTSRTGEPALRSRFAQLFYGIINTLSDVRIESGARDFRVFTSTVKNAILQLTERERFSKGIFPWIGFRVKWFEYQNIPRAAGATKWSFKKLFRYAIDGILAFTTVPLRMASIIGLLAICLSIVYLLYRIIRYGFLITTDAIIIVLLILIGGTVITLLGVIGEYLAKIYAEVKMRPIYLVRETNFDHTRTDTSSPEIQK